MDLQTTKALSTASVIVGVRIPTRFRNRRLLGRRTHVVGTWDIHWYHHEWQVGWYRGRDVGEGREGEEQRLSSRGKNHQGWERHDLEREFCVRDTIRAHDLRICCATNTSRTKRKKGDTAITIVPRL